MHLLNYKQLARDLRDNKVSEKQKLQYFIALAVITTIGSFAPSVDYVGNMPMLIVDILIAIIGLFMMIMLYRQNQNGDGKHFLERYICLSFPMLVIMFMVIFIISTLFWFIVGFTWYLSLEQTDMIYNHAFSFIVFGLMIWTFFLMQKAITIASTPKK